MTDEEIHNMFPTVLGENFSEGQSVGEDGLVTKVERRVVGGLTKRELIATIAMGSMLASWPGGPGPNAYDGAATGAVQAADALLKALAKI